MSGYDPKLKEAMAEIVGVLKKHDIAGYISLVSPTHSEFCLHPTPSWSAAFWEEEGKLRFRVKQKEVGRDEAKKLIELTCHMIYQMRDLCAQGFHFTENMAKEIEKQIQVDHVPYSNFTPDRKQ
jgi:hypothetical protein